MTQARDLADGKFDTNTLVVDAANNRVGIGTASPSVDLEIASTAGSIKLSDTDGSDKETIIKHSGGTFFLQARDGSSNAPIVLGGNGGGSFDEHLRVLSGGGLTFNGDTATANALDDYETGTWTPSVSSGMTSTTYDAQTGVYIKIGDVVIASFNVDTSGGTANGNQVRFDGLPYAKKNSAPSEGGYITYQFAFDSVHTYPYVGDNQSYVQFHEINGTALLGNELSSTDFICRGTVIYRTA